MEILKKSALLFLLLVCMASSYGQNASTVQAAFSKSYVSEQAGNFTGAINDLKAVYNAKDYIINIRMGWLYYNAKQYTESINFYEKAIALKPYAIEARFGCVKPLSAIESWEKVKEHYLQILKIDPQNVTANYWLGVIFYNKKDYLSAGKLFEKVVNLYPLDYDSIIMLGWTKLNQSKQAEARSLFLQALILRPNDSSANSGLKLVK